MENPSHLMTVAEFLRRYACSRTTFYREVAAKRIKLLKLGTASRIKTEDAELWAASLPEKEAA